MPLAVQIILCLAALVLVAGVVGALLVFPQHASQAPFASRERVRSLAGLLAVLVSDTAIVMVTIWGVDKLGGLKAPEAIALVTGAFTAVSTMTTAYLGIKAVSNTAQVLTQSQRREDGGGGRGGDPGPDGPTADPPRQERGRARRWGSRRG
ncbi:hypothetical protein ACIGEZ_23770 [Streptomyces sp. NPDC085481]|uniref:hypothetical protein n=1 Tax=Streptomyces sp. NPDC085481 TaxID=3365727 RepID=UPI0037D149E4